MLENVILTGIVMGLTQAVKGFFVESRWVPLIAIVLGIGGAFAIPPVQHYGQEILEGVISGLVAVGLYSSTKNTMK